MTNNLETPTVQQVRKLSELEIEMRKRHAAETSELRDRQRNEAVEHMERQQAEIEALRKKQA